MLLSMLKDLLVPLLVLVTLGPALLAYILRRRRPALAFWPSYRTLAPGFVGCAVIKVFYHLTGWFVLDVAAPVVMVVGVWVALRRLER